MPFHGTLSSPSVQHFLAHRTKRLNFCCLAGPLECAGVTTTYGFKFFCLVINSFTFSLVQYLLYLYLRILTNFCKLMEFQMLLRNFDVLIVYLLIIKHFSFIQQSFTANKLP